MRRTAFTAGIKEGKMKTVKDFFENIEDQEELIFLGGG